MQFQSKLQQTLFVVVVVAIEIDKIILTFLWKSKGSRIAKTSLKRKITPTNFKTLYEVIEFKAM